LGLFGKIEWYQRRHDAHDPLVIKQMSWSWFSAELVRIRPTEVGYRVEARAAYLALHDFVRSDGETTINGANRSTLTDARGTLTFVPVGSSVEGWNRFERRASTVAVHLAPTMSDYEANDISNVPPSLYFKDNTLKATLQKLQSVMDASGLDDHAYAETLGLLLLWELRHVAKVKPSQLKPARGGLTAAQLRRVKELIDAQISTDVTISDLAVVAELSQFHFIRAFKESVGLSPYQYILSERVRRAKELLSKGDLPVSDVALAAGFHNAYQMNRVFRKLVGLTPTALRRQTGVVSP
jgi:AraC family transcriptional regulator